MTKKLYQRTIQTLLLIFILLVAATAWSDSHSSEPDSLRGLLEGGKFNLVAKTLFYQRDFDGDTPDRTSLAVGGNINVETATWHGLSAGIGFKTSQGELSNTNDEVYRGLLAIGATPTDDEDYTALDEYFLRYEILQTRFTLGAQTLNTPWLHLDDSRMTPKKYRGFSIINSSIEDVELHAYYLTDWMDRTSEDFESIASGFTKDFSDDEGTVIGGVRWQILPNLKMQAWDYYFIDVLNSFYTNAIYSHKLKKDISLIFELAYLNQQDTGDSLAGDIDTYSVGGSIALKAHNAKLSTYYGTNGDDDILYPFGHSKIVNQQNLGLERADEDAWGVKLDYSFEAHGAPGLSAYAYYASYDTPDSGENASPDAEETDLNLQYKFRGKLDGLSLRLRHAIIDRDSGSDDWNDTRVLLVYKY